LANLLTFQVGKSLFHYFASYPPQILHIASHSFYEDEVNEKDILLKSGIVLANSNDEKKPKENNNILTALEITKMDLRFTEMVVVSSCKSGPKYFFSRTAQFRNALK
tara:strand:+ start:67 stop:387 length:321 start_codon:yes stop_codon:yes gene_type:complete